MLDGNYQLMHTGPNQRTDTIKHNGTSTNRYYHGDFHTSETGEHLLEFFNTSNRC